MELHDVPADTIMTLTTELDRAFKAANCNPTCHVCREAIEVSKQFQLVSFMGNDQMTCSKKRCGRQGLQKQHNDVLKSGYRWSEGTEGERRGYISTSKGYSRPSKEAQDAGN